MIKPTDIKIGLPVTYYPVMDPKAFQDISIPTVVRSEPWKLGHGEWVCKVEGLAGGVLLSHLVPRILNGGIDPVLLDIVVAKLKFPCHYHTGTQCVFDQENKMICDIRGWGWIQNLGANAGGMQDALGRKVAELINTLKP